MRFLPSAFSSRVLVLVGVLAGASLVGCGRTDLSESLLSFEDAGPDATTPGPDAQPDSELPDVIITDDGFSPDGEFDGPFDGEFDGPFDGEFDGPFDAPVDSPPDTSSPCGDGTCDDGETCSSCPLDCGFCPKCGDGTCNADETCSSCPQDCGSCEKCGDGFCNNGEDCLSCPADCGVCASCGDGTCSGTENCTNCPKDCGKCVGCGDGVCSADETCVSCPQDCGSCAVCGNGVCNDGETCINCAQDCGACVLKDCQQALICAFGCFSGGVQNIDLTCITDCEAEGCPTSQVYFSDAVNCAVQSFFNGTCGLGGGSPLTCIEQACATDIARCFSEPPCP
jgi:hypothetical protein